MSDSDSPHLVPPLEMTEETRQAIRALTTLSNEDVPKVHESVFGDVILAGILGKNGPVTFEPWIIVAGNIMRPIDVVDDAGVVLFRAPPALRSLPSTTPRHRSETLGEIVQTANQKTAIHPVLGARFLEGALNSAVPKIQDDPKLLQQWNRILRHYGEPLLSDAPEALPPVPSSRPALSDEDEPL